MRAAAVAVFVFMMLTAAASAAGRWMTPDGYTNAVLGSVDGK
jgi:hypothetical protein